MFRNFNYNRACRPGGHYCDYSSDALSCSRVNASAFIWHHMIMRTSKFTRRMPSLLNLFTWKTKKSSKLWISVSTKGMRNSTSHDRRWFVRCVQSGASVQISTLSQHIKLFLASFRGCTCTIWIQKFEIFMESAQTSSTAESVFMPWRHIEWYNYFCDETTGIQAFAHRAPIQYLNQSSLIIKGIPCHSHEGVFTKKWSWT